MKRSLFAPLAALLLCMGCAQEEGLHGPSSPTVAQPANALGGYLGVTLGFQYSSQLTGPPSFPTHQNLSLYNPDANDPDATWDSWAEQLGQAGVDFVCPNLTGTQPNPNGDPAKFKPLLTALKNRGLDGKIKFALFDDNAASWTAQWNMANGRGYGYPPAFDISDQNNWKYIYDYNYKKFYEVVPDANRFKLDGRPVIIVWTGNTYFIANPVGNISRALAYVRQRCQADFGFNPYIILSGDFFDNDPTIVSSGVADAQQNWFGPPTTSYSLAIRNGTSVGVAVAQFYTPDKPEYLDPEHGQLLERGLANTVGAGARLTLCEGFTDYEEDAALWRASNLDASGNALSYAQTGYDFPNQRLNILRKYSSEPFPAVLKLEAEGCDSYGGAAGGNGKVNYYRNGNIAIEKTTDAMGGHQVGFMQAGEWFQWEQVPLNGNPHLLLRVATPGAGAQVRVEVDGVALPAQTLPTTGGWQNWTTYDYGSLGSFAGSYHKLRVVFTTGGANFNWLQVTTSATTTPTTPSPTLNGTYKLINRNSGLALDVQGQLTASGTPVQQWGYNGGANQRWTLTRQANGQYTIQGVQSGLLLEVAGQSLANGASVSLYTANNGANQRWVLAPTSGGYYTIQGAQSGKVLEVEAQSTTAGALVKQYSGNGGRHQQWALQTP